MVIFRPKMRPKRSFTKDSITPCPDSVSRMSSRQSFLSMPSCLSACGLQVCFSHLSLFSRPSYFRYFYLFIYFFIRERYSSIGTTFFSNRANETAFLGYRKKNFPIVSLQASGLEICLCPLAKSIRGDMAG